MLFELLLFLVAAAMAMRLLTRKLRTKFVPSFTSILHSHATSFGFKEVRKEEKSQMVGHVFDSVALKYDLMNDIMSAGLHRLWKDRNETYRHGWWNSGQYLACRGCCFQIYVCEINPNMLNVGKKRAIERGLVEDKSLLWLEEDAEALRFGDNSMDSYTIAFGIRNVTHTEKALTEAYRVLKPGGRFLCLELNRMEIPVLKELYDLYSFSVIPAVGKLVTGDRDSYQYLIESIRRFPPQETFASMIAEAGFKKVEYESILGGVVAIHSGLKL